MTRVFFDMDGTLAEFEYRAPVDFCAPGYYLDRPPQRNVIEAASILFERGYDVYICSAIPPSAPTAIADKTHWLNVHMPWLPPEKRVFAVGDARKSACVPNGIRETDILVDDYTPNLMEWAERATAVKMLNGINGTKGTWTGASVSKDSTPRQIAKQIITQRS